MAMARRALQRRRSQQAWTQEGIALALGVATSTYRSWETGDRLPRIGQRPKLARLLDVSLAEVDSYLDCGASAPNGHQVPTWLNHLASLEQGASRIWAYQPIVMHSLLQTARYAAAIESADPNARTTEGVAQRVELRTARQGVLTRGPDPLNLSVVLDESVLHRVAGDAEVMADQLGHLANTAELPNVDLHVLPLNACTFAGAFGSFTMFASGYDPYMVAVEDRCGAHYLDRQTEVDAHVDLFGHLSDAALSPVDSVDLINATNKERYL